MSLAKVLLGYGCRSTVGNRRCIPLGIFIYIVWNTAAVMLVYNSRSRGCHWLLDAGPLRQYTAFLGWRNTSFRRPEPLRALEEIIANNIPCNVLLAMPRSVQAHIEISTVFGHYFVPISFCAGCRCCAQPLGPEMSRVKTK